MIRNNKLFKDILIFILFFIIWFCLYRFTGSISKGYNIYEDNIFITTHKMLDSHSVISVSKEFISADASGKFRFRPVWAAHLVTATKLTGANLTLYTFYIICIGILSSFLLYKFLTIAGYSHLEGFIFGLLIVTGPSAMIWSEITDSENIGMLLFSLTLYLLAKSIYSDRSGFLYKIFFIISLALTALCKESFILIIPAVIFIYVRFSAKKNDLSFIDSLKFNRSVIAAGVIIFLILLSAVYFTVGYNNQTYAGVDTDKFGFNILIGYIKTLFEFDLIYLIIAGALILILPGKGSKELFRKNSFVSGDYLYIIILFLLITFPQYLIYYKSGFSERYLLPFMTGFYFLLIFIFNKLYLSVSVNRFLKYFYLICIAGYIFYGIVFRSAPLLREFSNRCRETTKMTNEIIRNSGNGATILFAMDPVQNYHEVFSLKTFLGSFDVNEKYYYDFIKRDFVHPVFSDTVLYNQCERDAYKDLGNELLGPGVNKDSIKCISVFWSLGEKFLEKNSSWFKEENFRKDYFGSNILYSRK